MFCKRCETDKTEDDFYTGTGGYKMFPCKTCRIALQKERDLAEATADISVFIKYLRSLSKSRRAGALMARVKRNGVTNLQFYAILKEVRFV